MNSRHIPFLFTLVILLQACVSKPLYPPKDSIINAVDPVKILVIPPLNLSPELQGTYTFLSTVTKPLAEKGYYVYPVAIVDAYFKLNGVPSANDMNQVDITKLNEQFSPDAILYTQLDYFGQRFAIFSSYAQIAGSLRLIDAKTGQELWSSELYIDDEQKTTSSGGLTGKFFAAVIEQAIESTAFESKFFYLSSEAINNAINSEWLPHQLRTGRMLREPKEPLSSKTIDSSSHLVIEGLQ